MPLKEDIKQVVTVLSGRKEKGKAPGRINKAASLVLSCSVLLLSERSCLCGSGGHAFLVCCSQPKAFVPAYLAF